MNFRFPLQSVALCLLLSCQVMAEDWPQFRGPHGAGLAAGQKPPIDFGPNKNLLWKSALPPGASSPCVVGDRLFLTAVTQGKLETVCLDRADGGVLWRQVAPASELEKFHPREGSPASATPASDGERVVAYFASFGLLAYDLSGKELWRMPLPIPSQAGDFGSGASPVVYDGQVLLNRDQMEGANLLAVDVRTGKKLWQTDRPDCGSSFGTVAVWDQGDRIDVVLPGSTQIRGYALETGEERWRVYGLPTAICTTPVVGEGSLVFAGWSPGKGDMPLPSFASTAERLDADRDGAISIEEADDSLKQFFNSYDWDRDGQVTASEWQAFLDLLARGKNVAISIRPGGLGDITETHVDWSYERGLPYVASPLVDEGRVYFVKDGGLLTCLDLSSGEALFAQERLGAPGSYYASPVAAGGHLYLTSLNGVISVVKMGNQLEVKARNDLEERIAATPAIVDNTLYVRTDKHLYAFGRQ